MAGERQPYLDANCAVKNADQEDMLHHQPGGHGRVRGARAQEDARQSVIHVLPAVAHVQLLQLATDGGQVRLTQPAHSWKDRATVLFQIKNCFFRSIKKN